MKLLLDENISYRLAASLAVQFPETKHVIDVGLQGAKDDLIYQWAAKHNFALVTKDADFIALAAKFSFAAPIVLIRLGNVRNDAILSALLGVSDQIDEIIGAETRILEIS